MYKIIQIKAVKNKCGIPLKTVQVKMFLNGMIEPIDEGELEIDPSEEITHKLEPDSQDESTFTEVAEDTPKPARKKKRKKKLKQMSQIKFSTRLFLTPGEKVEVTRLLLESLEIPFTTSRGAGIVRLIEGSSSFISGYFESQT